LRTRWPAAVADSNFAARGPAGTNWRGGTYGGGMSTTQMIDWQVATSTGVRWVGSILTASGREFLDKMAEQEVKVQNMSGAALAGLVASGEVPLSPTIFDADVTVAKQKGAPIEWRPLDPVVTTVGYSALSSKASHPHAALLFIDYVHSKEGQQLMMKGGLWSPRGDVGSLEQKFKKLYLDDKYSMEELEKKLVEWENLMQQLFIRKRP